MAAEVVLPNGWAPRSYQLEAWRYLQAGGKHAELIWHRRAGKDDVCLHYAAIAAMKRRANYWHMLPQASQARKAVPRPHIRRPLAKRQIPHASAVNRRHRRTIGSSML